MGGYLSLNFYIFFTQKMHNLRKELSFYGGTWMIAVYSINHILIKIKSHSVAF